MKLPNVSILLFAFTGCGKTAQIGEVAEWVYKNFKLKTRLYTADRGGFETIRPYVDLGIIEVEQMTGEPWIWMEHAVRGEKLVGGKWVPGLDGIGVFAYEGLTSFSDEMMRWMRDASTRGVNIGGGGAMSFTVKEGNETLKIGSSNMGHYSQSQAQIYELSAKSQSLPGIVLWTAGDSRGEDDVVGSVVGPQMSGKAKTAEAPRWFKYTWQLGVEVQPGQDPVHVLYTKPHTEMNAKMARTISNSRIPLAGTAVNIPAEIRPASVVKVLELLEQRQGAARDELKKRLGL